MMLLSTKPSYGPKRKNQQHAPETEQKSKSRHTNTTHTGRVFLCVFVLCVLLTDGFERATNTSDRVTHVSCANVSSQNPNV